MVTVMTRAWAQLAEGVGRALRRAVAVGRAPPDAPVCPKANSLLYVVNPCVPQAHKANQSICCCR